MLVPVALLARHRAAHIIDQIGEQLRVYGFDLQTMARSEVLTAIHEEAVDAVLFHPSDLSSREATALVRSVRNAGTQPIIVLHDRGHRAEALDLLEYGATDLMSAHVSDAPPQVALRELRHRLSTAIRERPPAEQHGVVCIIGDVTIHDASEHVVRAGRVAPLTTKEFRIVRRMCATPNELVGFEELMHAVWPEGEGGSVRTLRSYIARIRKTLGWLGPTGDGPWIRTVRGRGYVLEAPEP